MATDKNVNFVVFLYFVGPTKRPNLRIFRFFGFVTHQELPDCEKESATVKIFTLWVPVHGCVDHKTAQFSAKKFLRNFDQQWFVFAQ